MMRCPAGLPVLTGVLATLCVRSAFAGGPPCSTVTIEADVSVNTRWPGLQNDLREAFEARDDIDRCARVALTERDASVTVEVVLPDGRSATRSLSRREDVVPTLEALLVMPQRSAQALQAQKAGLEPAPSGSPLASPMPAAPSGTAPAGTRPVPSAPGLAVPSHEAAAPLPGRPPSRLRIELSVITGARIGDGQVGVGLGAFSFLEVSGWLVGFEGRADRYEVLSGGTPSAGTLELGVLGGPRFRFQNMALDLIAGPAAVLQGTTTFESKSTGGGGSDVSGSSSSTAPRLLLGARVNFGARSLLHVFVGVDGELGPPRLGDGASMPGVPRLPVWTLGLALGATVGTQ
jgi:hypothetical protein